MSISMVMEGIEPQRKRFAASEWKAALRAAFEVGAAAWVGEDLPKRFTPYAGKLGYYLRSTNYMKRKVDYGATAPLVWTGDTADSVLSKVVLRVGGSAAKPWVKIPMRVPGPRAPIVYKVLSTILTDEMPKVAQAVQVEMQRYIDGAVTVGGRSKKMTFSGISSRLGSRQALTARSAHERRENRRWDAAAAADDHRTDFREGFAGRQARVQARLKRTHDRWRRQAGGSAPTGGPSRNYAARLAKRRRRAQ